MTQPCVYLITNNLNGKLYVGKANNAKSRWGQHLSAARVKPRMVIARAIQKHGAENFRFEVLETFQTEDEAFWWESWWIQYLGSHQRGCGYNLDTGGNGGKTLTQETRQKLSDLNLGRRASLETKAKMSTAKIGKKQTQECIEKRAASNRGRTVSVETRAKIAAKSAVSSRGRKPSIETREKISAAHLGRIPSAETRAKMSAAKIGCKRSPEAVAKGAAARRGKSCGPRSLETRAKIVAGLLGKKQSPETIEKRAASNRNRKRSLESVARMTAAQQARRTKERVGGQVIPSEQDREYLRSLAALAAYDQGLNPGVASEQQQELRLDAMDRAIDVADAAMQAALEDDDDNWQYGDNE